MTSYQALSSPWLARPTGQPHWQQSWCRAQLVSGLGWCQDSEQAQLITAHWLQCDLLHMHMHDDLGPWLGNRELQGWPA